MPIEGNAGLSDLISNNPELVRVLRKYEYCAVATLIGGLLTMPKFHANTVRLHILAHLALLSCTGAEKPNRESLVQFASLLTGDRVGESSEDPVEDVFVGNVATGMGNFRIFRGVRASGDRWVESALQPFFQDDCPTVLYPIRDHLVALLRLTDLVAGRAGLQRYFPGESHPWRRLSIPRWRDLVAARDTVSLSLVEIQKAGISYEFLEPFVLTPEDRQQLSSQSIGHTALERRPLLRDKECVVLVMPHSIIQACLRFITERVEAAGMLEQYAAVLQSRQAGDWFIKMQSALNIVPAALELPPGPLDVGIVGETVMTLDEATFLHFVLLDGNIAGHLSDADGMDFISNSPEDRLAKQLLERANFLAGYPGCAGGLTLIARAGLGRSFSVSLPFFPENWGCYLTDIPDWETLLHQESISGLLLWLMWRHEDHALRNGLTIRNLNGPLALFCHWRSNDWRLITREMPLEHTRKLLIVPTDAALHSRLKERLSYDRHSFRTHRGDRCICIERLAPSLGEIQKRDIGTYVPVNEPQSNGFLVVFKGAKTCWWFSNRQTGASLLESTILFRLRSCVMYWVKRIIPVMEAALDAKPDSPILIELEVESPFLWADQTLTQSEEVLVSPQRRVDPNERIIGIKLPITFRNVFYSPTNSAEVAIVRTLIEGYLELSGEPNGSAEIDLLVLQVVPNTALRHFHVLLSKNPAVVVSNGWRPPPKFIPVQEQILHAVGLAQRAGGRIRDRSQCLKFLAAAVWRILIDIQKSLSYFSLDSVVKAGLTANLDLEYDDASWQITAKAQHALQEESEKAFTIASDRTLLRDQATLANRVMIETAMYSSPLQGGRPLPLTEHLRILGKIANLITIANHRDAIDSHFMEPEVNIFPNGEIDVDPGFYRKVMYPYISEVISDRINSSVASYERYFPVSHSIMDSVQDEDPLTCLEAPFRAEFGLSIDQLLRVPGELANLAETLGCPILDLRLKDFLKFLMTTCEFSEAEANAYLKEFSIRPRKGWNLELPAGYEERDVYPWGFRRRLSILMRPLTHVGADSAPRLLVSPVHVQCAHIWLLWSLHSRAFPPHVFRSPEMKSHWGKMADIEGIKFEGKVSEVFKLNSFLIRTRVSMRQLGVPRAAGDLGDIDVVAWQRDKSDVWLVECKHLRPAHSVRDVVERMKDYHEESGPQLAKHTKRVKWLTDNPSALCDLTGLKGDAAVRSVLVTSDLVPMEFVSKVNPGIHAVVSFEKLSEWIRTEALR